MSLSTAEDMLHDGPAAHHNAAVSHKLYVHVEIPSGLRGPIAMEVAPQGWNGDCELVVTAPPGLRAVVDPRVDQHKGSVQYSIELVADDSGAHVDEDE
jgi:hypothetical protein